jgi:amidase
MARSARDLAAALDLLGGPDGYDKKAWSWKMPAPRRRRLKDYRVGFVMDDPMAPPTSEVKPVLERALAALERAGVQVRAGWPSGYELNQAAYTDQFLLSAFNFTQEPAEQ